jgi:type I restriction enzyme M protein
MSLHVNAEAMSRLKDEKAWAKLTVDSQTAWTRALKQHMGAVHPFAWAESFVNEASKNSAAIGKVAKTFIKALINAFGVRDPEGEPVLDADGNTVPDTDLTDYENVPFLDDIHDYFAREVLPHAPDAWIDETYVDKKDKAIGLVGYEINFNRFFYKYEAPPKLEDIDRELKRVESEIAALLGEVTE